MLRIKRHRTELARRIRAGLASGFFVAISAPIVLLSIADAGTVKAPPLAIPVTLLEIMRAAVEIPADGIWEIQFAEKLSDGQWLLADQDAVSLAAACTLISLGGSGPHDRQWVANADWQSWTRDVQKTALQIRAAAHEKDQEKLSTAADHLTEVCQNCHTKYRPAQPSDGVARYPFYPKRVLAK
jgi:hypothetical protein